MTYLKLYRSIKKWRYADKPEYLALWIHLLSMANWEDGKWHEYDINKGQLITSIEHLSIITGIEKSKVRRILQKLNNEEILLKTTNKNTQITIIKWGDYQCDDEKVKNKRKTSEKQVKTIKEEYKKNKKEYICNLNYDTSKNMEFDDNKFKQIMEVRNVN